MIEHHRFIPAVIAVVYDPTPEAGDLLLHRRQDTGFLDGLYDAAGGHLEPRELPNVGAARELQEETGLLAQPDDLELFHIIMATNQGLHKPYAHMFFKVARAKCLGNITLMEPDKCSDIGMFRRDSLPDIVPHLKIALDFIGGDRVTFSRM